MKKRSAVSSSHPASVRHGGTCSLHVRLVDDPGSSAAWAVRLLSGVGTPAANAPLSRTGSVGFWVYAGGSGMSVAVGIDDSDGTERSVTRAIPANRWTYVSWSLADAAAEALGVAPRAVGCVSSRVMTASFSAGRTATGSP